MARPFRKSGGRPERDQLRQQLFDQQAGLCHLCGQPMTLQRKPGSKTPKHFASFDHVVPHSAGGTAYYLNLKLAHRSCNSARGSTPIGAPDEAQLLSRSPS